MTQPSRPDWTVIVLLSCAQFVMVLDTTVMNVSLTQVAADIDATIPDLQLAITFYTLTMAAFMLTGGKLGDVFGRRRTFAIGCVVYGIGSLTTALAPNLAVLLVGWSLIEGLGATLVIPAILALTAANYSGPARATAYGILGGIAAAGAAAGPLIGGYVTETWTWRLVFAGETVLLLVLLLFLRRIADAPLTRRQKIDPLSVALSAAGLGLLVFGILRSSEWGWVIAKGGPEIGGETIEPFGFSLVPLLIGAGAVLLTALVRRQEALVARGADALLDPALLKIAQLRSGLAMLSAQQLVLAGTFFTIPVYLQVVLGKDALETGIELLPATAAIVVCALGGARMSARRSPRTIVRTGMLVMVLGVLWMAAAVTQLADTLGFSLALALFGAGVGLMASQLGNVIMSAVEPSSQSEAAGMQGTWQNLGASLGTALIGAVLLSSLASGFAETIEQDQRVSSQTRAALEQHTAEGTPLVPVPEVEQSLAETELPQDEQQAISEAYGDAQVDALKQALIVAALLGAGGLWFARRLPDRPLGSAVVEPAG